MSTSKTPPRNPLGMYQLEQSGPFVLPSSPCTTRREELMKRGNSILGFYSVIGLTSGEGHRAITKAEAEGTFDDATPFEVKFGDQGPISRLNYGLFKKLHAEAGANLTNQVFLMLHGSFEAYILDLVGDAIAQSGVDQDPFEESVRLMAGTKWRGKVDRIGQKFGIALGKKRFVAHFKDFEMGFLGEGTADPIEFLEKATDLRHRLVHAVGRVDAAFAATYPKAGLSEGDKIRLPLGLPVGMHLFFVHLSDLFDKAFASRFGWKRRAIAPETLTEVW